MAMPPDDPPPGVPEWVVTYGDMMSLLLTFFIMLVSISELKQDDGEIRAMMDAIREAFGPGLGMSGAPGTSLQTTSMFNKLSSRGARSEGGTERRSRQSKGAKGPHKTVKRLNHGTVVTLGGPATFERFDAELNDDIRAALDIIVRVIRSRPNRIMVRGHATPEPLPENLPISGKLPKAQFDEAPPFDKWDLSFLRAQAVAQYLVEQGIDSNRLVVSAAGDSEPRAITRDPQEQRQNRRVDVFLIDSYISSR